MIKNYWLADIICRFKYKLNRVIIVRIKIQSFCGENFLPELYGTVRTFSSSHSISGNLRYRSEARRHLSCHCLRVMERSLSTRCKRINSNSSIRLTLHLSRAYRHAVKDVISDTGRYTRTHGHLERPRSSFVTAIHRYLAEGFV